MSGNKQQQPAAAPAAAGGEEGSSAAEAAAAAELRLHVIEVDIDEDENVEKDAGVFNRAFRGSCSFDCAEIEVQGRLTVVQLSPSCRCL